MLDFIKDIFAAFRQNSLERMKSPFLGAFVFSWLGFNWQLLAILFISKKDVEERIIYINQHFDIESLLIGPLFTTTLICILLPQATKHIVKMQSKPISDATLTTMTEKIALAEKQLEIADIESKKRLSDKREERNIEEDITSIKRKNLALIETVDERDESIRELSSSFHDVTSQIKAATTNMAMMTDQNGKLLETIKDKDVELTKMLEQKIRFESEIQALKLDNNANRILLESLQNLYPTVFNELSMNKENLEAMKIKFRNSFSS